MVWIVEIGYKKDATDPVGYLTKKEIEDLGIKGVEEIKTISTYAIDGKVTEEDVKRISEELLVDNQIQHYGYSGKGVDKQINKDEFKNAWLVEVSFKPGVMDAVGLSTSHALEIMGIGDVKEVKTGTKFLIIGDVTEDTVEKICKRVLVNDLIQDYSYRKIGGK